MRDIVDYADATGKRVVLTPGQKDDRHGTTSRSRLVTFYKRFGFVENKGRAKDFTISESMYREPVTSDIVTSRSQADDYLSPDLAAKFGRKEESMTIGERIGAIKERLLTKLRQGVVDQFASLKDLSETAWMKARMSKASSEAVAAAFLHGKIYMDEDGAINVDENGQGLVATLAPLGDEVDRFLQWIAGNRSLKLKEQGKENLFSDEDIAELMDLNLGEMADGRDRAEVYAQTFAEFNEFANAIIDISVKSGMLDAEIAEVWRDDFYVPFYRVAEEMQDIKGPRIGGGLVRQQAFKKLKGGKENLNDLLHNTIMNWEHLLSASLKNNAARDALTAGKKLGVARRINAFEAKHSKDSVFIKEDGKDVHYEVSDPLILQALSSLHYVGANNAAMKLARGAKRIFTMGVTASPEFRVANLLRDTIQTLAVGGISLNPVKNITQGFAATGKDKLIAAQMMAGGATMDFGYQLGSDADAAKSFIRRLQKKGHVLTGGKPTQALQTALGKMWRWWEDTGNRAENVNRAALYQQLLDQGKSHFEASFEAADLLDFRQSGAWPAVRFLTQIVPFINARVQGLDKLGRAAMDKKQRGQFTAAVGAYSMAAIALYLMYRDDDDFKAREEWDRDSYLWFKLPGSDTAFRIPAPFEVGAIGAMAARTVEQFADASAEPELFFERLGHAVSETMSFSPAPQLMQPMLDVYANKDPFTDRPIESTGMQRLPASQRYRASTTVAAKTTSAVMEAVLPDDMTLSPVQLDYLVDGYLGWVGSTVSAATDTILRATTGAPSASGTTDRSAAGHEEIHPAEPGGLYEVCDGLL